VAKRGRGRGPIPWGGRRVSIRVALIGCGQRGLQLADVIRRCESLELAAVCDVDEARLAAAAGQLGLPGERDHRRLLERSDIQAFVVATSARWHADVTLDALAAGRHVYVEKPLADSPAVARRMAQAAEAAGVVAMVGYQQRFTAFAAALAAELPPIEPQQAVLVRQRGPMNPQYFFPDHYGGIVDTATHTLDLALWAMGGTPEGVMGHVRRGTIMDDRTIEFMELVVDFDDRTRSATIVSSMLGVGAVHLNEFVGRRGSVWSTDNRNVNVTRHAGIVEPGAKPPAGMEQRHVQCAGGGEGTLAAFTHFGQRIAGASAAAWPRGCTFAEGANAIALSAAMVRSSEEGRRIALSEVE